jgi:hypothetical protein
LSRRAHSYSAAVLIFVSSENAVESRHTLNKAGTKPERTGNIVGSIRTRRCND